jgi:2-iminobutanoate/2-iminopropanoate deaminase
MRRVAPLFAILLAACATAAPVLEYHGRPDAPGPFSEAVRSGNLLFLSGQIGSDSTGKLVPGGIGPETRQTLENIKAILERNGSDMNHVVKCTVFLADIAEWPAMNQVYRTFFPATAKPARSAFAAGGLVFGARLELECIAAMR